MAGSTDLHRAPARAANSHQAATVKLGEATSEVQ